MTVVAGHSGTYKQAEALYASQDGEWVEVPLGSGDAAEWTRPADWLTTNVGVGEQKVQCLVHVGPVGSPETMRAVTITVQGAYTVNWGDGTAPQNGASNATLIHMYDPTALAGTMTSDGWLQAIVTITPQTGNLTSLLFSNGYWSGKTWRSPMVELVTGPSTITSLTLGSIASMLHRVELKSKLTFASGANLFAECKLLREIVGEIAITGTTVGSMFLNCYKLKKFPTLTFSPSVVTATSMFQGCGSMTDCPPFTYSQIQGWSSAFVNCYSLVRLPSDFSTAAATTTTSMFQGCGGLEEVPPLNTSLVATMNNMFNSCGSLRRVSLSSTALATNVNAMFNNCSCLEELIGLDFSTVVSAANLTNVFGSCFRLMNLQFLPGKGPRFNFTVSGALDAAGLDALYTSLPVITGQTITISGHPGTLADTPSIATAKGWTVTGS